MPTVPIDPRPQYPELAVILTNSSLGREPYAGVVPASAGRFMLAPETARPAGLSPSLIATAAAKREGP